MYPSVDGALGSGALSNTASAGLILGAGAVGSGLLVLTLTVLAVRRGARAAERERRQERLGERSGAYPRSSIPYKIPKQDSPALANGRSNGHRPPGSPAAEIPTTPYSPPEGDG